MKPMLAATPDDLSQLRFPLLASPKLDGFRAIIRDGVVYSRRLKPIPNIHVQKAFSHLDYHDGELIFGSPTSPTCFRDSTTACMTRDHEWGKSVSFHAFDHFQYPHLPYSDREFLIHPTHLLKSEVIYSLPELLKYEESLVSQGYEGIMTRQVSAPYKYGRSTMREQFLVKVKRFVDGEFPIVGFEERMHNANPAERNAIGQLKRSSHKENQVPMNTLGSLILQFSPTQTCSVGSGFTDAERDEIWANRPSYLGRLVKVKWFPVGMKDLPRHPVFLGFYSE